MKVQQILETCVYAPDLAAAEQFYRGVLGMELHSKDPERHLFFRVGNGMFLVFNPNKTRPDHGCVGRGHAAFAVQANELEAWRCWLNEKKVPIVEEITWPTGGHSIYFRDPAENSLELDTPNTWYKKW